MPSIWDTLDELKNDLKEIASDVSELIEGLSEALNSEDPDEIEDAARHVLNTLLQIKSSLY
ncbi:hypothetical protein [Aneurinibacillus aneurinilyticus]|uniref:hypothetical protein n=1 Tax=Aneurinibacillus aneurinilyticus TaxID=1391 RepID=UPI0035241B96